MSARFRVDLLHPGSDLRHTGWVAQTWEESLAGPAGGRWLLLFALGCAAVLAVVFVAGILPVHWKLTSDTNAVPGLRRDLAARDGELRLLRSNLTSLAEEARRQVRWGEVLTALAQQIPATLKLQSVASATPAPAGAQAAAAARADSTIRIEAVTLLRPGNPPLLDVARFMAGLMRDPAVNKRFQLQSWELKPGGTAEGGAPLLSVSIVLAERSR
jgi:hypothetical protein